MFLFDRAQRRINGEQGQSFKTFET